MKNKYLHILVIFFLLATVNELYRPWVYVNISNSEKWPAGYHIIGYKPEIKSTSEINMMFGRNGRKVDFGIQYNYTRLYLQRASILALFLTVLLCFGPRNKAFRLLAIAPSTLFLYLIYLLLITIR